MFHALARLLDAGVDPARAFDAMVEVCQGRVAGALRRSARSAHHGVDVCAAGAGSGLWTGADEEALRAAQRGGAICALLERLALRHEARARRSARLRARLTMPLMVLCAGVVLAPLPALVAGEIGWWAYFARIMGALVAVWASTFAIVRSGRRVPGNPGGPLAPLLLRVPAVGTLLENGVRAEALDLLAALLEAGLPVDDALALATRAVPYPRLRSRLASARARIGRGTSVAEALRRADWLEDTHGYPVVAAAEEAGRLAPGLSQYVGQLRGAVTESVDFVASWGAKAVYLLVLVLVAGGMLGAR